MPDTDVISKSVTKNDYTERTQSGVMQFFISSYGSLGAMPSLPPFWSHERDLVLLATIYREPVWASAIWKYCTRQIARQWEIESSVPLRARKAQELFLDMDDGRGWASGLFSHLQAYRLTGNGGWVEIVRASSARGSKIIGLVPLDPLRCTRTGNPAEPIFYRDVLGNFHWLKDYQVFNITDQPDTGAMFYRLGHCAAERAYNKILQMEGLERYFLDKLTGRRPSAIHIVNGLRVDQIEQAYRTAEEDAQRKGLQSYMGVAIATVIDPTATLSLVTIPITEVPDGFNPVEERKEAKLVYAANVGIPVQELDPTITAPRALSSAQDLELQETSEGQNVWEKEWVHAVNKYVLDDRTQWAFPDLNLRDELLRAQVTNERANAYKTMVDTGSITPAQSAQMLVDENEIPESFLPAGDATDTETITDEEKPVEAEAQPESELLTTEVSQVDKAHKSISSIGGQFESELSRLVQGVFSGRVKRGDLSRGLRSQVKSKAEPMFIEGMLESGSFDDADEAREELENEDLDTIEAWVSSQEDYILGFAKAVADTLDIDDKAQRKQAQAEIETRIGYWRNSLEGLGAQGKMSALKNEMGVWVLGHTEQHCEDKDGKRGCKELAGEAHRMSYYAKNNLNPGTPGSNTTCGGFQCQCKIRSKRTGKVLVG